MKAVGAALECHVHHAASSPSILGVVGIGLTLNSCTASTGGEKLNRPRVLSGAPSRRNSLVEDGRHSWTSQTRHYYRTDEDRRFLKRPSLGRAT